MKGNKIVNRIITVTVMLLLFLNLAVPTGAATGVAFSLNSKKYENGTFVTESIFDVGDKVCITVDAGNIPSIGGITLTLNYDKDLFNFRENESFCAISDEKSETVFNNNNGKLIAVWETTSSTTKFFSGPMFYFVFSSKETISSDTQSEFSFKISELFDGSNAQNNIKFTLGSAIKVNLKMAAIPEETLNLFRAIENVTYSNESLEAIIAAEKAFGELTSKQQKTLLTKYADLYDHLNTARSRYNKLAEKANLDKILQEVDNYLKKHSAVLSLTVETIKLENKDAIDSAVFDLDHMSLAAKSRFDATKMSLIRALGDRVKELEDESEEFEQAKYEAEEFKDSYSELFKPDVYEFLENDFKLIGPLVSEALLLYSIMPEASQEICSSEYAILQDLKAKIDVFLANDARESEIMDKITDFQQQYIQVFKINSSNVSLEDETAIKMVLAAFQKIEDEDVKDRLSTKMKNLENFLTIIDGMKKSENNTDNSNNVAQSPSSTQGNVSQNSGNINESSDIKTIVKEVQKTKYAVAGLSTTIWMLLILLALSILLGIATFFVYFKSEKPRVCEDDIEEV